MTKYWNETIAYKLYHAFNEGYHIRPVSRLEVLYYLDEFQRTVIGESCGNVEEMVLVPQEEYDLYIRWSHANKIYQESLDRIFHRGLNNE
jgi:hypothetical protein